LQSWRFDVLKNVTARCYKDGLI